MLDTQFQVIYQTLLAISQCAGFFPEEKEIIEKARAALATANSEAMWQALLDIALSQGFHTDAQTMIGMAQTALRDLMKEVPISLP